MMKKRSLTEFGLTSETLFDIDLAIPYWLQLGHQEFLMSVIHELKMQPISSNAFLKDIVDDEQIANLPVARFGNKKTVKEVCEIIKLRNDRTLAILDLMWQYALQAMKEDE